jgi:hemerythrin-like domain-containing protein
MNSGLIVPIFTCCWRKLVMEKATQVLEHEQKIIRKVVTVIAQILEQLEARRTVDADLLRDVVQFMRIFCDQCHHAKQESYLFPLLESKGMPREGNPVIDLRREHGKGRLLTRELSLACSEYIVNQGAGRLSLMQVLDGVLRFYGTHMWKEEYFLLPMTDKLLSVEDQELLVHQFRAAESDIGVDTHFAYEALAEDLQKRVGQCGQCLHRAA